MFKKNPNRPPVVVELKKVANGYKVQPNESIHLFVVKRVTRTMYRRISVVMKPISSKPQIWAYNHKDLLSQPPSHVTLPAFAGWFSLETIHPIQREFFPQFFHEELISHQQFSFNKKNSRLYKYYRNTMIGMWRQNVKKHLSSAHCRRNLMGDVSTIIRIHGFLENWGLINFPSKEHSKGMLIHKTQKLSCYICQDTQSTVYQVAVVEDVLFQICNSCFQNEHYPQQLHPEDFVEVLHKNYRNIDKKIMNNTQLIKMLEILSVASGTSRDKDRDAWNAVHKQFPEFNKEEIVFNFLRIPLASEMNANIFQNNQDVTNETYLQSTHNPSIFQDFQNPLQASIAISYYQWKTQRQKYPKLAQIFSAAERHAANLASQQQSKIEEMCKMLAQVAYSKLQHKALFVYEYQKLIEKSRESQLKIIMNNMAQSLKKNVRLIQYQQQPQQLQVQGSNHSSSEDS